MRRAIALAAAAAWLTISAPAAAQEFKPPANLFGQKTPVPKPPKVDWSWRPSTETAQPAKPAIVCGMTIIPADPKIDPKMRVAPRADGTTYTLKVVPPTVCRP
jgi:hypothetical protein